MTRRLTSSDWAAGRGAKWGMHLEGMEAMLKPVDGPLIDALNLDRPCRVVDVGCGGGGTAFEIARRAPAGSVVHGVDISPALIELARSRMQPDQTSVAFELMDVESAPAADPYDRIVSRFGTMFFRNPPAAFAKLREWLAPSGRFAFAVWGPREDNPWEERVRGTVAEIIELPVQPPDAPGPFRYSDSAVLLALLGEAGFGGFHVRTWRGPFAIGGGLPAMQAASFALSSMSSFSELLAEAGAKTRERALQLLTERLSRYEVEGTVRMNACAYIVTGTR